MTIEEVFKNKDLIIAKKKNAIKHADIVLTPVAKTEAATEAFKAGVEVAVEDPTVLRAKLVINTTNVIDSHMDCHIPGIWTKTLKETKQLFLLQEHEMDFENIIADSRIDDLKAYTQGMSFKSLGFKYPGETEALVFDVQIKKDVNEYMFDLYKRGRVTQHSVGMRYLKIFLCINSDEPEYSSERANWNKYYEQVANKEVADLKGFFWAVTEAQAIEGSAVVRGSNECTPVMEIEIEKENTGAEPITPIAEPSKDTQTNTDAQDAQKQFYLNLLKNQ
jgi:hypothetical protein